METHRLCLVPIKFERKCKGKKITKKSKRKKKVKKNKNRFKVYKLILFIYLVLQGIKPINCFDMLLQIHFTYFIYI